MAGGRNIKGIVVEIGGNVGPLQKALESVNKTIKNTQSELRDVERLLKLDPTNTELLSQKQEKLKTAISATKEKLDALKTAQEQAKQQMENGDLGKDKYDALQREIIETEEELKRLAREAAEANTALNKIDSVGRTMENVGNKMSSVGSSLTRNVTAPILAIGTAAVKTTADFDAEMSKVSAISGATGETFDSLREKAREMGAKTKFSATEAAQAFEYMAMAGWKDQDMLEGIEGIMNLAAASGEDLATTSDIVTDALTAFGLSAKDSGHFADVLAAASSNANTNVSLLGESFKYAAPVAGALGISAEDTSVALGLMANAGIKASQSGTALRTGLTNLAKPTKQMQTYMDKYNIALVENDDGSINLRDTMISLREKMGDLSESEQAAAASAIFGKNSMAGWLAIINASDEDFDKLTSAIDNCDGSAQSMAETMQDNLAGQITILKSALQELMIQIGDALMPTVRAIVAKIQEFVLKLQQMDEGTRNTIIKVAAFAAALGPVLLVVGKLTTGIGQGLQAISSLGKGILTFVNQAKLGVGAGGKLATAIAGIGPVGWAIIAVVAALTAAFVTLWKNNEEFRNKIIAIWEGIKEKLSGAMQKITDAVNKLGFNFKDIIEVLKAAWEGFCNFVAPILEGAFKAVGEIIEGVIDVVTGVIEVVVGLINGFKDGDWSTFTQGLLDIINGVANAIWGVIQGLFQMFGVELDDFNGDWGAIWKSIKSVFESVWTAIKNFFVNVWNSIVSFFTGVWNGLKNTVTTIGAAIGTAVSTAWNAVKGFFESIWNAIRGFFEGIWNGLKNTVTTVASAISSAVSNAWNTVKGIFESVWNAISGVVSSAWETIKNVVTVGIMFIKELFSAAFQILTAPFRFIWENCKDTVVKAWDGIKNAVSKALDWVKEKVTAAWNAVKTTFENVWNGIKSFFSGVWDGIKSTVSTVMDGVKTTVSNGWNAVKTTTENVWNSTKTFVSNTWENIKSAVGGFVDGIKDKVSTVWTNIKTTVGDIMGGIKDKISEKWEAAKNAVSSVVDSIKSGVSDKWTNIKSTVSTTVDNIKTAVSDKWTNIKDKVGSVVDTLKSGLSSKWESIKSDLGSKVDTIKSAFESKWNAIKDKVGSVTDTLKSNLSSKWESIKSELGSKLSTISSDISSKWEAIKSNVGSKVDSIKSAISSKFSSISSEISSKVSSITSTMSSGFQNAYNTVSSKFESIKSKISSIMNSASSTVQSVINSIKSKFNFSWSLPHLKLPHLSITGSFSINPPSVPHFSISWYKKAMENGMILNAPTIFGMKGNKLLGGGEAGSETVVGTDSLLEMIRKAVLAGQNAAGKLTAINNYGNTYGDSTVNATINVYAAEGMDEISLARNVADIIQNQVGREAAVWA